MSPTTPLAEYVREQRELRGWSKRDLADRVDVTRSYITRLESGAYHNLTMATAARLADALQTRVADLFTLAGYPVREIDRIPARVTLAYALEALCADARVSAATCDTVRYLVGRDVAEAARRRAQQRRECRERADCLA